MVLLVTQCWANPGLPVPISNALVSAPLPPSLSTFTIYRGCASPWLTTSSLSEHRFLLLNGFYGRMSPTSLTWSFLNKGHVGFCQLHPRSCHTPSCLPGISAWQLQPEKSLLGSCGTRTECDLLTFGRDASLRCIRAAE